MYSNNRFCWKWFVNGYPPTSVSTVMLRMQHYEWNGASWVHTAICPQMYWLVRHQPRSSTHYRSSTSKKFSWPPYKSTPWLSGKNLSTYTQVYTVFNSHTAEGRQRTYKRQYTIMDVKSKITSDWGSDCCFGSNTAASADSWLCTLAILLHTSTANVHNGHVYRMLSDSKTFTYSAVPITTQYNGALCITVKILQIQRFHMPPNLSILD